MSDTQTIVITGAKDAIDDDDVLVQIGDAALGGWKDVRITAGIESCPRDFELQAAENTPDGRQVFARPGDPCEVYLGRDKVVTGYVNRWQGSITATSHSVQLSGRGMCQDLVDCSAKWPGQQIKSTSVLAVAQELASAFGIRVRGASGPSVGLPGPDRSSRIIPYAVLMLGETAWEVIDRMCKLSGLLAFEQADGSLLLAEGPSDAEDAPLTLDVAGTGFEEGVNVETASLTLSDDQRFSEHETYWFSFNPLLEFGEEMNFVTRKSDPGVARYRPNIIIAEAGKEMALQQAQDRGSWEAARRWGQGHRLLITTDTWRDSGGKLYRPFTLARVRIPSLKLDDVTWVIGEVTYRKGETGTACDLVLAPIAAFAIQPTLPQYAVPAELAQLFNQGR